MKTLHSRAFHFLTLFASMSTLICCALPAFLVSLGMGAVLAGMASSIPELIWVSENKIAVFVFAGVLLAVNGLWMWRNQNAPCPIDPELRDACISGRKFSKYVYFASVILYLTGFFFAFVAAGLF